MVGLPDRLFLPLGRDFRRIELGRRVARCAPGRVEWGIDRGGWERSEHAYRNAGRALVGSWCTLVDVWERSVRAAHDYRRGRYRGALRPRRESGIAGIERLTVAADSGAPCRVRGVAGQPTGMLFVAPEVRGRSVGGALLAHAVKHAGVRTLDVNEQNPQTVPGSTSTKGSGKSWQYASPSLLPIPFTLLHAPSLRRRRRSGRDEPPSPIALIMSGRTAARCVRLCCILPGGGFLQPGAPEASRQTFCNAGIATTSWALRRCWASQGAALLVAGIAEYCCPPDHQPSSSAAWPAATSRCTPMLLTGTVSCSSAR